MLLVMNKKDNNLSKLLKGDFIPEIKDLKLDDSSLVFGYSGSNLLLINNCIPNYEIFRKYNYNYANPRYIGKINDIKCFSINIEQSINEITIGSQYHLYKMYTLLPENYLKAAIYGFQIFLWDRKTKFCGSCGSKIKDIYNSILVKQCSKCREEYYPKISPVVIIAVTKNDKILLAQHNRMKQKLHTVLAGFVDPGETIEECIHREIREEANIEVKNIRYFGSQPWPFPDSLMLAFQADYDKGELKPDLEEISDLRWFTPKEIPEWPDKVSIARSLIENFIKENT
jgi:NAD+ diphosphatase